MTISIKAAWARRYMGAEEVSLTLVEGATCLEAALAAGIPLEEIGFVEKDGLILPLDTVLSLDSILKLHPAIIGG